VLVFLLGKFMRKVFFGQLRAAEMEVPFWLHFDCIYVKGMRIRYLCGIRL
jgi:hypothetical protein